MRKLEKKYKILISIIIILLSLTILIFASKRTSLMPIEKIIRDTGIVIEAVFYKPISFIQDKITTNVVDKNSESLIEEQKQTIEKLKQLLNITYTTEDYEEISATVIKRNLDNFYDTLIIDKGEMDGIKENMAVVTSTGLIGLTKEISYKTSSVQLLTSSMPISIKIRTGETEVYGILKEYRDNYYIVEGISENTPINIDDEVVTTGLGHPIPSGILIGTVAKEEKDHFDLNRTIYVTPSANTDKISYVKVLKRNIK